jgi:lipopolysaccharide/colanic/teichoic acid biosynthesis glycosyltransferase
VLRKCHFDELPQLVNIVAGEMSFVGPRPERPAFVKQLVEEIPGYAHRLTVLPGVTGLAQINLDPDQTVDCVRRKLELDLQYIFTSSWDVDVRITLCTALEMLGVPRRGAARLMLLSCAPTASVPASPHLTLTKRTSRGSQARVRQDREPLAV